jgi:DNA-directed RNA polymerase specialized sigma24 family protein
LGRYSSLPLRDLICFCAGPESNNEAWQEFDLRLRKPISLAIIRVAYLWHEPPGAVVEDLVQETYLKLWADGCRHLRDFAVLHPEAILGYVKTVAANLAHDHFRHQFGPGGGNRLRESTFDIDFPVDPDMDFKVLLTLIE